MNHENKTSAIECYKKDIVKSESFKHELADCARIAAELDQRMEQLHTITKQSQGEK